jgi:hypothetical protein
MVRKCSLIVNVRDGAIFALPISVWAECDGPK